LRGEFLVAQWKKSEPFGEALAAKVAPDAVGLAKETTMSMIYFP
jgi:hypothetical protein